MKKILLGLLVLSSINAFAGEIRANCVSDKGDTWIFGSEDDVNSSRFLIRISHDKKNFVTDIPVYKGVVEGVFVKITSKGDAMFNAPKLGEEYVDQSDYSYVYISKELMNGKNGSLTLSARQLGDSEGAWWLNQTFTCKVKSL